MSGQHDNEVKKGELHPFGPRVLVVDPPADEQGGIILPQGVEKVSKGIVVEASQGKAYEAFAGIDFGQALEPGDVVYYKPECAIEIGKTKVLTLDCIVAYER